MREDEAKTKWCPFVRTPVGNRDQDELRKAAKFPCIGSACMAWRTVVTKPKQITWDEDRNPGDPEHPRHHGYELIDDRSLRSPSVTVWRLKNEPPPFQGYCGLAGQPS